MSQVHVPNGACSAFGEMGLSTRQYFAARAPQAVPEWFTPTMSSPRPTTPTRPAESHVLAVFGPDPAAFIADKVLPYLVSGPDYDGFDADGALEFIQKHWPYSPLAPYAVAAIREFSDACVAWRASRDSAWEAQAAWDREYQLQTVAQWPWAWADLVLGAENRK